MHERIETVFVREQREKSGFFTKKITSDYTFRTSFVRTKLRTRCELDMYVEMTRKKNVQKTNAGYFNSMTEKNDEYLFLPLFNIFLSFIALKSLANYEEYICSNEMSKCD